MQRHSSWLFQRVTSKSGLGNGRTSVTSVWCLKGIRNTTPQVGQFVVPGAWLDVIILVVQMHTYHRAIHTWMCPSIQITLATHMHSCLQVMVSMQACLYLQIILTHRHNPTSKNQLLTLSVIQVIYVLVWHVSVHFSIPSSETNEN